MYKERGHRGNLTYNEKTPCDNHVIDMFQVPVETPDISNCIDNETIT